MSNESPSFAEQDRTVARVAETALRMMAGSVGPATQRRLRELCEARTEAYPWEDVVRAVLAEPLDASQLVQRGLQAQRDWIQKGGTPVATSRGEGRAGPARARPRLLYSIKRWLAIQTARALFYSLFAIVLVVLLILLRRVWPAVDIYALGDRVVAIWQQLFG